MLILVEIYTCFRIVKFEIRFGHLVNEGNISQAKVDSQFGS